MKKPLKILFLSMHYKPEPCDTRTSMLAEGMSARGHEAQALTSFPNYPFGKIYDGYRQKLRERREIDGVDVVRVPMFPDHSMSKKRRMLSYLSFGFTAACLGTFFTKRPDLIWIHHPPLTTGIAGFILAKLKRVPYVYEIHDLWPETLTSTGMISEGRVTRAIRRVCNFLHKRAAAIVVSSPGMAAHLAKQGVPDEKLHVFYQWAPELPVATSSNLPQSPKEDRFQVLFTGNLGVAQGLDTVLDAAKQLFDLPEIRIVMVGAGVELDRLKKRTAEEKIDNVEFVGQVCKNEVPSMLAGADALLVHLKDDFLFSITVPSKVQTYMQAGKPILCGVAGDAASLVSHFDAGICFQPEDSTALADAVRQLYCASPEERARLGLNAQRGYSEVCSQSALLSRYEALFLQMAAKRLRFKAIAAKLLSLNAF